MNKWRIRLGYGVGDLASNLVFMMMSAYLMIFYTDVFGLTAAVAGMLMLITRIIDAFTDVGMGLIIDRTHTKWGKSRPYFLFGAVPFALIAIATFTVPVLGPNGKIIYAFVTYIALSCLYTVVNIPMSTILPTITTDARERTILVSARMVFSMIGSTAVTTFTTPLVLAFGKGSAAKGYMITIIIYAVIAMFLFFVTFKNTEEKVHLAVKGQKSSIKKDLTGLNAQCLVVFFYAFIYFSIFTIRSTSIVYYFTYNLNQVGLIPMIGIFGTFSGLPVLLALPFFIEKLGKRNVINAGAVTYISGTIVMAIFNNVVVILIGLIATGMGMYLMQGTLFAIAPDLIDYTEYRSGRDINGLVNSLIGFIVKLAMGISGAFIGLMLTKYGYVANTVQTSTSLKGIKISYIWIPSILCIIIMIIMRFYNLDQVGELVRTRLQERIEE